MGFNDDETWADLTTKLSQVVSNTIYNLNDCHEAYQKWLSFKAGRSNAQVATALGKTEAQISSMDSCFQSIGELWSAANNIPIDQLNRVAYYRLFA